MTPAHVLAALALLDAATLLGVLAGLEASMRWSGMQMAVEVQRWRVVVTWGWA